MGLVLKICLDNLCLGVFRPFTFNIIIDMVSFRATNFSLVLFVLSFFVPLFFLSFLLLEYLNIFWYSILFFIY